MSVIVLHESVFPTVKQKIQWQSTQRSHKKSNTFVTFLFVQHLRFCCAADALSTETEKFEIKNHLNNSSNDKNVSVSTEKGGFKKLVHICHSILRCPHRMAATLQEKKEEDRHQRWNNSLRSTRNTGDKRVKHKNRKHRTSQVKSLECSKQNSEKFTSNCNYCYCRRYVQFIFGIFFCFSLALHYNIGSMYISFVACTNEKWNETEIKKNGG